MITGSDLKLKGHIANLSSLTSNRLNCHPSVKFPFKTTILFVNSVYKDPKRKRGPSSSLTLEKQTQAGDTRLPIRKKAELETGSQLQQKGRRDSAVLSLSALSAPQRRPQQVGLSQSPGGTFLREDRRSPAAKLAPCAQTRDGQTGGAGGRGRAGRGRLLKKHALWKAGGTSLLRPRIVTLPPQLLNPTQPQREPLHPQAEVTQPIGTFRAKASNAGHWFPAPTSRGRKSCLRHRAGSSNPGTLSDATLC